MAIPTGFRAHAPTHRAAGSVPRRGLWWLLVGVLLASGPLRAQSDDELLSINMRDADITAVIQWIAEKTHKQIVIDPRVKGKITVLANQSMTVDQAYQVFLAALDVYGYGASEQGGILRIFPGALGSVSPARIVENYGDVRGGEQIVYVYRAQNVAVTRLQQLVRPLVPAGGVVQALPDSNTLIIGDDAANVKRLLDLMAQIDSSGDFNIEVVGLRYATADKVAGLVSSLLGKGADENFAIASDPRSNSVLLSGDPATRERVAQLIAKLDRPISASNVTRVVHLNYLDAEEVVPILKGLTQSVSEDSKDIESNAAKISIEGSKSANAVIMTAPPGMLDLMEKVIRDIDIRRAQVLVEAIIVEVSKDFSETIGVEWNTNLAMDNNIEAGTNLGLPTGVDPAPTTPTVASLLGAGLNLGFYRNGSLRALAQAIANENNANILSTPSILTLDNQEAEILVGSNIPIITGQSTSSGSTTDNPFTTFERQDIGLTLKITPKVNEGDSITLDVLQEIESVTPSTEVTSDIVTNKRSIKTKVLVDNDNILVLGGLISDDAQTIEQKVPFLGDIPLVGLLFKSTTEKRVKKNLMVFIHPVIVDGDRESSHSTRAKYDYMKELQRRYNSGDMQFDDNTLRDFDTYRPQSPPSTDSADDMSDPTGAP